MCEQLGRIREKGEEKKSHAKREMLSRRRERKDEWKEI